MRHFVYLGLGLVVLVGAMLVTLVLLGAFFPWVRLGISPHPDACWLFGMGVAYLLGRFLFER